MNSPYDPWRLFVNLRPFDGLCCSIVGSATINWAFDLRASRMGESRCFPFRIVHYLFSGLADQICHDMGNVGEHIRVG